MRFYEYESKALLARHGVALPKGSKLAKSGAEAQSIAQAIGGPVVLKSQVLTGGRMKAGGVLFADTPAAAASAAEKILALEINGHRARGVLVEGRQPVAQEYYLGVTWDGIAKRPVMILSDMGGIDIEEVAEKHPEHIAKRHFSTVLPFSEFRAKELVAQLEAPGRRPERADPLRRAARAHLHAVRADPGRDQPAGEARRTARSWRSTRTSTWRPRSARSTRRCCASSAIGDDETRMARAPTRFELDGAAINAADHRGVAGNVTEFDGTLGLIIGAGGGSLTLFDAVRKHGGDPANYCEIGGNPSVGKVANLTKLILAKPGVKKVAVMMNVVSNTRVDMVARGVIKGVVESGMDPADKIAVFRIPGSWEQEGEKLLRKYGVEFCDRTVSMYEAAGRAVAKMKGA